MADEIEFFSNDCNNWNYNAFINTPNADPYNLKWTINISSNNSYNLMKYNAVNMFKEISKHTNKYLNDDVKEWIYKKADDVKEWIYKSLAIFRTLKRF